MWVRTANPGLSPGFHPGFRPAPARLTSATPYARCMDDDANTVIADHLLSGFKFDKPDEIRAVEALLDNTLKELPQPDNWCPGDAADTWTAKALLLADDKLIEVSAYRDEQGAVRVKSLRRPLANSEAVVGLESYDHRAFDGKASHKTKWTFRFRDGHEIEIRGGLQTKPEVALSGEEDFARAVAAQIGEVIGRVSAD
jgi:hypothetical protein